MIFLAQNYPHDKLYESVIGISRLIIDRFEVIQKILSPSHGGGASTQASNNSILLGSLFELFRNAIEAAIHSQTIPQLSSSSDFLLVTFPKVSQKAILHTAIIQAVFVLLAQEPPHGLASADFKYLIDLWIPTQPLSRPEVSTIEGNTKLALPPKEVLHSTLLSENTQVLELAVASAKPSDLGKFVQQFGSPVIAVWKVLEVLDDLCQEHNAAAELRQSILDPLSVAKCLEIQMCRGIKIGKTFLTFVAGLAKIPPDDSKEVVSAMSDCDYRIGSSSSLLKLTKPESVHRGMSEPSFEDCWNYLQGLSMEGVEQQLLLIFGHQSPDSFLQARSEKRSMLSVLEFATDEQVIGEASSELECVGYLTCLVTALYQLLSGSPVRSMQFLEGMIKNRFSLTLLTMIVKLKQQGKLQGKIVCKVRSMLQSICQLLESSVHKVDKLKLFLSFVSVLNHCCQECGVSCFGMEDSKEATLRACSDVRTRKDPFENETSLIKLCCYFTQNSSLRNFETLINTLVRKSVVLNQEFRCIRMLQSIRKDVATNCAPVACRHNYELFSDVSSLKAAGKMWEAMKMNTIFTGCSPDVAGLLVDMFELLDPEIFSLCLETAAKFLFGSPESHIIPSSSCNFLLSGQGYLLARLVNNSSWNCLLGTINHMLDKNIVQEWYVCP